ncbi:ABC transporter permease [Roseovarius indicus]|uniref:ABC transporter permease n=1 Tax=Roseovarius indicus TaxID=540747 RepID=A0A0T5P3J8_9RHOB|nr:ABC transporter permease [Roseovarius indicus]KRS15502.1 ABC transporter permease [Roseovarius indicus]OAN98247.1 ABC transporter permease [Roseovarius indicus]QEW25310.1 Glutathione transport system permease protein GsiC [Roseovarius indicus]SFE20551.1 peptide/nickel transport system permease protein [Roseovarius indicus]
MLRFIFRRAAVGVLVLVAVAILTFALTNAAVDPARAIAGDSATADDIQAIRELYGFDRPLHIQFLAWAQDILQGDLGQSYRQRRPVSEVVLERLPVTMILGASAFLLAVIVAIPLGILAGLKPNSWIDRCALTIAVLGQAIPNFWLALMGIVIFSVQLRLLPASGSGTWQSFILPSVALAYYAMPTLMRLTRAGMIDTLQSDYIRTARAKGLLPPQVVLKHALRNAILPLVSVSAVQLGMMLGGSVVIETIFAMQGIGYLAWESITMSDPPVVQAIVLTIACFYVLLTLTADIINAWLDPRLRGG